LYDKESLICGFLVKMGATSRTGIVVYPSGAPEFNPEF
jgi:hypothetical protein